MKILNKSELDISLKEKIKRAIEKKHIVTIVDTAGFELEDVIITGYDGSDIFAKCASTGRSVNFNDVRDIIVQEKDSEN